MFLGYAGAFYASSRFILSDPTNYDFTKINTVMSAVIFTAMAAGQISTFAPNISKAKVAAVEIFKLIDAQSTIDPLSKQGRTLDKVRGDIVLKNVRFAYPRRPDVAVMADTSITIKAGETVAFVGGFREGGGGGS